MMFTVFWGSAICHGIYNAQGVRSYIDSSEASANERAGAGHGGPKRLFYVACTAEAAMSQNLDIYTLTAAHLPQSLRRNLQGKGADSIYCRTSSIRRGNAWLPWGQNSEGPLALKTLGRNAHAALAKIFKASHLPVFVLVMAHA